MWRVVCLCADWCSACRAWRPDWDALAASHPRLQWQWLDIEDEAQLMDAVGLDIETFPTVLLMREDRAIYLGAVPPQPAFVDNLIARLGAPGAVATGTTPQADALAAALALRSAS